METLWEIGGNSSKFLGLWKISSREYWQIMGYGILSWITWTLGASEMCVRNVVGYMNLKRKFWDRPELLSHSFI